jgi:hypothetical protein
MARADAAHSQLQKTCPFRTCKKVCMSLRNRDRLRHAIARPQAFPVKK